MNLITIRSVGRCHEHLDVTSREIIARLLLDEALNEGALNDEALRLVQSEARLCVVINLKELLVDAVELLVTVLIRSGDLSAIKESSKRGPRNTIKNREAIGVSDCE